MSSDITNYQSTPLNKEYLDGFQNGVDLVYSSILCFTTCLPRSVRNKCSSRGISCIVGESTQRKHCVWLRIRLSEALLLFTFSFAKQVNSSIRVPQLIVYDPHYILEGGEVRRTLLWLMYRAFINNTIYCSAKHQPGTAGGSDTFFSLFTTQSSHIIRNSCGCMSLEMVAQYGPYPVALMRVLLYQYLFPASHSLALQEYFLFFGRGYFGVASLQ